MKPLPAAPLLRVHHVLVASIGAVALLAIGCGGGGGGGFSAQYRLSVTRLKQADLGLLEYVGDYDDVLPPSDKWMDGLLPYAKNETLYHSPAVGSSGYGYALNASITGLSLPSFSSPSTTVTLFDSTDLARNATDMTSSEPNPARYSGRNTIAYLDGHVQDEIPVITPPPTPYEQSQTNLKKVSVGMLIYSSDYDDGAPLANKWMDELAPYIKNDAVFHSPSVVKQNSKNYGYALSSDLAGQVLTQILEPSTTISFFDSTVLTRNATAPTSTMPNPPRYGTKNTIAYADGHVH